MKALRSACRELLRYYEPRLPRVGRIELVVDECVPFGTDNYRLHLSHETTKGTRHAVTEVNAREMMMWKHNEGETIRVLDEKIAYLVTLLFPTPTPKAFRRLRRRSTLA